MRKLCRYFIAKYRNTLVKENSLKTWITEQKVLGRNFAFYVMVAGLADWDFRGIRSADELLSKVPPKGRE